MRYLVAADTGGTFTDIAVYDSVERRVRYGKSLTRYENLVDGVLSAIDAQIGWNIYFEVPEVGGDTVVYGEPWRAELVDGQAPPSYGLDTSALASAPRYRFQPRRGELVFFNVRNPHLVNAGTGDMHSRVSIGAFVGRMPDGSLVHWS